MRSNFLAVRAAEEEHSPVGAAAVPRRFAPAREDNDGNDQRMEKDIIVCKDIKKAYGTGDTAVTVLKGVTFSIKEGEFVAIMGPSGSGKSTLMHILGALDTPTSGHYFLDGKDVSKLSDEELADIRREKIGFVFQAFNLLPRTSVLRNVSLPLIYANMPKEEREVIAKKALDDAAFPETFWSYHSNQLSGGMMQRVAIARSLVNNPALILADEPTGNLDSKTGEIVLHTFQNLNMTQGKTVVLITHEPYVAQHADRIIHIRDGNIITDEKNHNKLIARKEKDIPHDNT
jgi:putative ABC transport system ATP-binding protein